MRIPHVVVESARRAGSPLPGNGVVALSVADDRHLRTVLRLRDGAALSVTDGVGGVADAVLAAGGAEASGWRVLPPPPDVVVHPAVSKGAKLDFVVEKATELGVRRIEPVWCERSERRWDEAQVSARRDRWAAVARAALAQCRGAWLPEIDGPVAFARLVDSAVGTLLHPGGNAVDWASETGGRVAVGPEGGFADDEVDRARNAGWRVAGLGERVLRTETASVVAATLAVAARGGFDHSV